MSTQNYQKLRIATFNMHDINNGLPMLNHLLSCNDIIIVQEHWLLENNFGMLLGNNNDFDVIAVSAMSKRISNEILRGRPFGGVAIMWRTSAINNLETYLVSCNSRFLAILFESEQCIYFVTNLYLPCSANYTDQQEVKMIK